MDPLSPPEMDRDDADGDARRKIQFSVPSPLTTQLDPRQVEMVSGGRIIKPVFCCFIFGLLMALPSL